MIMLKLLKKVLKILVSRYSNKSSSIKIGTPIDSKFKKINKYIKTKIYIFKLGGIGFSRKYNLKSKFLLIFSYIINIFVTGVVIKYCLENRDALSYGLSTLLITFYFEKVVTIIKQPIKKNVDEE